MVRQILNGEWMLTYSDINDKSKEWGRWIPATVPGDIHIDLMRANIVTEALIEENNKQMEWTEEKEWWYKRVFTVSKELLRRKTELVFEGIDLTSDIWLNGCHLGGTNNMFRTYRFDISKILCEGQNTLKVRVDAGFKAAENKPIDQFPEKFHPWDMRNMWMRKATQCFFWDITPRLITCGIWKDVYIEAYDQCRIEDYYVRDKIYKNSVSLRFQVSVDALEDMGVCDLSIVMRDEEQIVNHVVAAEIKTGNNQIVAEFDIAQARLWWPNGVGESHLYDTNLLLTGPNGNILDTREFRHGIRTIEVEQKALNENESTFTFLVNGERVFCKGGDWVPPDTIFTRITKEKEYMLLKQAKDGNQNMMRIWGGGIYPDQDFYDICDELGIMVWQDFMLACSYYPDFDGEFCNEMKAEIEGVVGAYRNHASLALWSGNNENQQCYEMWHHDCPLYGQKLYDEIMPEVIGRLDPDTFYWPSSPYGGEFANSSLRGDQHIWDYSMAWLTNGEQQLNIWGFSDENHKFISEFGIESPANTAALRECFGKEHLVKDKEIWNHHNCWYAFGLIEALQEKYYRDSAVLDMQEYILSGQMIQAEAIKDVLEKMKGRMYECSGTLYWQYNESWAQNGYCVVDYYGQPKQSYYYMKRAFAPVHIVFVDDAVVAVNDTLCDKTFEAEYGYRSLEGKIIYSIKREIIVPKTAAVLVGKLSDLEEQPEPDTVFAFAALHQEQNLVAKNRKFLNGFKNLRLHPEQIEKKVHRIGEKLWRIDVTSDSFMWDCNIIDDDRCMELSDNAFDLWPGEKKTIFVTLGHAVDRFDPEIITINRFLAGR